jgi:hypothetical protein
MAISRIQQTQVSGSLSYDDSLEVGSSLLSKSKLSDDLNALRSLIKDIKGTGNWYQGATQDLHQVYGAMRADGANADFQGEISSVGLASVGGALFVAGAAGLSGSLAVAGNTNLNGNVHLGDASSDSITFNAKAGSALDMNSYKISELAQASTLGDALAWGKNASVSDLIVSSGDFTVDASGNVSAASLYVSGAIAAAGAVSAASAAFSAASFSAAFCSACLISAALASAAVISAALTSAALISAALISAALISAAFLSAASRAAASRSAFSFFCSSSASRAFSSCTRRCSFLRSSAMVASLT